LRVEHSVKVDVDKIVEILHILTGDRVTGLVGIGEGIEKGLQGPFEELDEGFLDPVFSGPAKHRMLENVGNPGGILGRGSKRNPEDLVFIVVGEGEELCPGLFVPIETCRAVDLRNPRFPLEKNPWINVIKTSNGPIHGHVP